MLSLVLCTLGNRIEELQRLFESLSKQTFRDFEIILVTQDNHDDVEKLIEPYNFKYLHISSNKKGLSIARNIGLDYINGDYFSLTDDDCWYPADAFEFAMNKIASSNSTAYCFNFFDPITNTYLTNYSKKPKDNMTIFDITGVTSFEIFFNKKLVYNLKFDENFGVGSLYNSSEEFIYLMDLKKKYKAIISYFPYVIAYHPVKGVGQYLKGTDFISKAAIFRRAYGLFIGFFVLSLFIIKKWRYFEFKYILKIYKKFFNFNRN